MFIISGYRKKIKVDKSLGHQVCPNCHHEVERALAREKTSCTVFYIPVFGWTSKKFILCPCCGDSQILSGAEYKELKNA